MAKYQGDTGQPPPPPPALLALQIAQITYGETGPNVVRVYVSGEGNLQMDKRQFSPGFVVFRTPGHRDVAFDQQKPAPPEYPPGWSFYLVPPYPEAGIKMIALDGWVTGAPALYQSIERFVDDPTGSMKLMPDDIAICYGVAVVNEFVPGRQRIDCTVPTE
jgi:hypothetical protein